MPLPAQMPAPGPAPDPAPAPVPAATTGAAGPAPPAAPRPVRAEVLLARFVVPARADRPVGCGAAGAVVVRAAGRVVVEEPCPPPDVDDDLDADALDEDADADFADSLADLDADFDADDGGLVVDDDEPPSEAPDGDVRATVTGTASRAATTTWRSGRRWTTRTQGWPGTGTSWDATRPPRYGDRVASPGSASDVPAFARRGIRSRTGLSILQLLPRGS